MKVRKLKAYFEETDWPLSHFISAGVADIVCIGRWPFRRYAVKINDSSVFADVSVEWRSYEPPRLVPRPMEADL